MFVQLLNCSFKQLKQVGILSFVIMAGIALMSYGFFSYGTVIPRPRPHFQRFYLNLFGGQPRHWGLSCSFSLSLSYTLSVYVNGGINKYFLIYTNNSIVQSVLENNDLEFEYLLQCLHSCNRGKSIHKIYIYENDTGDLYVKNNICLCKKLTDVFPK